MKIFLLLLSIAALSCKKPEPKHVWAVRFYDCERIISPSERDSLFVYTTINPLNDSIRAKYEIIQFDSGDFGVDTERIYLQDKRYYKFQKIMDSITLNADWPTSDSR